MPNACTSIKKIITVPFSRTMPGSWQGAAAGSWGGMLRDVAILFNQKQSVALKSFGAMTWWG